MDFKKFKAATVQTSPIFLNPDKTVDKAIDFMMQAAQNKAQLIAFPEVFIAGYPYWNWVMTPVEGSKWYEKLYKSAVTENDECIIKLCAAAKKLQIHVIIGINERGSSYGEIYNTNLIINDEGIIIGKQGAALRKVGTEARKDIEAFFEKKVFLQLYVKVEKDWRNRERKLRNFGYQLEHKD